MSGNKMHDILKDTKYTCTCSIHKKREIPILSDNINDCREIFKQLLDSTKYPRCQYVDVLIADKNRSDKNEVEKFKQCFGGRLTDKDSLSYSHEDVNIKSRILQKNNHNKSNKSVEIIQAEMIASEENYVDTLDALVNNTMRTLKESLMSDSPILDHFSFNKIFINCKDLLDVNKQFLAALKSFERGEVTESFGELCLRHLQNFDCYKTYLLGLSDSNRYHLININKANKLYSNYIINNPVFNNLRLKDALIQPLQRITRYNLFFNEMIKALDPEDSDILYLAEADEKARSLNCMEYGANSKESQSIYLYTLIKNTPCTFIGKRQLLGYFDVTELAISTGKTKRPMTLLIFNDKIVLVKRKGFNVVGDKYFEKIEEVTSNNSFIKKTKEMCVGAPLEFKGWVDINSVELFHGLKDCPYTFFLRTNLPELDQGKPEVESEDYFRRNDRLFSIIPSKDNYSKDELGSFMKKKNQLIDLCQKQHAFLKLKDGVELYHNSQYKVPGYTHIYNEASYRSAKHKNNILIVYIDQYPWHNLHTLLTDDVWIVILIKKEMGGYKQIIRSRISLVPMRESRDIEYECIVGDNIQPDGTLDFISTLWNNLYFYERRLRATEPYAEIHDALLRDKSRARSRSRSLSKVANNMSIGKLFGGRSRSSSPSRKMSSMADHEDTSLHSKPVKDPILKIATVHHQESPYHNMVYDGSLLNQKLPNTDLHYVTGKKKNHSLLFQNNMDRHSLGDMRGRSAEESTYRSRVSSMMTNNRRGESDSLIYNDDTSHSPSSITSSSESVSSAEQMMETPHPLSSDSNESIIRSYFQDNTLDFMHRDRTFIPDNRPRSYTDGIQYKNLNTRRRTTPSFLPSQDPVPRRYSNIPAPMESHSSLSSAYSHHCLSDESHMHQTSQFKNDMSALIDNFMYSCQYIKYHNETDRYHAYESVREMRSHLLSRLDEVMDTIQSKPSH
ncbi:hypothetical protein BDB01DRAFT_778677 [Pilobolus umbonatus]|nr:hypothetical protein BDB01DRAFT_778677 [Pilobolus umbonatus]